MAVVVGCFEISVLFIAELPKELETGLDPPRIAKLLGESLRQRFQQSGLPDAARALDQSCSEVNSVQKQLVNVLREVAHPDTRSDRQGQERQ
jgi:hypothetical protein